MGRWQGVAVLTRWDLTLLRVATEEAGNVLSPDSLQSTADKTEKVHHLLLTSIHHSSTKVEQFELWDCVKQHAGLAGVRVRVAGPVLHHIVKPAGSGNMCHM